MSLPRHRRLSASSDGGRTGVLQRNLTRPEAVELFAAVQSLDPEGVRKLSSSEIRARLGPGSEGSAALQQSAYYNPSGGWAWSSGAIEKLYARLRELNVSIVPSAELAELIRDGDAVVGVKLTDGREFRADKVIAALGSWTGGHPALKGLLPKGLLVPTGQTVAAVQLSPEEMEIYRDIPVNATQDGTGYYAFPPTASGVMKFALHSGGYTVPNDVPRTVLDPAAAAYAQEKGVGWIPRKSLALLREKLGEGFPALAKRKLKYTRMCYYSDTPDGDFVIDYAAPGLLVASGGAGHAFKFLPVMGEIIHARLEDRLPTHLKNKWRINRPVPEAPSDDDRQGFGRQPLDLESLATTAEMGAQ